MGAQSQWSSIYIADELSSAAMDFNTQEQANTLDPVTVPTFSTEAARNAKAAPLITANPNVRLLAVVDGVGLSRYLGAKPAGGGQDWEWVGNVTPVEYIWNAGQGPQWGLVGLNSGGDFGNWFGAKFQFTPTRSGWADVTYSFDVISLNTSYGASYARPKFSNNGAGTSFVNLGDRTLSFPTSPRTSGEVRIPKRVRLTAGVMCELNLDVASFLTTAGQVQWQFASFSWNVTQQ